MVSSPDDVAAHLAELVPTLPGSVAVAVRTSDGFAWHWHGDRVVPSASTVKLPIMIAALRSGMPLGRLLALPAPADRAGGAGAIALLSSVGELTVHELVRLMIAQSDNDATNVLIDQLDLLDAGATRLREVLDEAGARHTRMSRRMMDFAAAQEGRDNRTCADDLVAILVALRQGRLLDPASTGVALDALAEQQDRAGLPAWVPEDVRVGNKTGELPGLRHDVALLERDERWAAVAMLATDLQVDGIDCGTRILPGMAEVGASVARLL